MRRTRIAVSLTLFLSTPIGALAEDQAITVGPWTIATSSRGDKFDSCTAQFFFIGDGLLYRVLVYIEVYGNTSNTALSLKSTVQRIGRHPSTLNDGTTESVSRIKGDTRQTTHWVP
jgi:hypothetical protein